VNPVIAKEPPPSSICRNRHREGTPAVAGAGAGAGCGWAGLRCPRRPRPRRWRVHPGQVAVTFAGHATAPVRYPELTIAPDPMLALVVGVHRAVEPGLAPGDFETCR
jgi:hypothetical protein